MRKPYYSHNDITLFHGNALDVLAEMEPESVHCCVTSPPYFGLRSYLDANDANKPFELGQEPTPEEYVHKMVEVFRQVKRVLRPEGTCWINIADSYAGSCKGANGDGSPGKCGVKQASHLGTRVGKFRLAYTGPDMKPKDLIGIPWMLAFALRADGWWLRSDIIWQKPNAMPESVRDRPTKSHEYVFLLSKQARYFYDGEAIREPQSETTLNRFPVNGPGRKLYGSKHDPNGEPNVRSSGATGILPNGRNKRSVWTISTEANKLMHFACFPTKLVEPCILAGSSEKGACPECGAPWQRVVERTGHVNKREMAHVPNNTPTKQDSTGWKPVTVATNDWQPTCAHDLDPIPCTILDPFCGVGTTGVVSIRHRRKFVGIDLKREYLDLAVENMDGRPIRLPLEVSQ